MKKCTFAQALHDLNIQDDNRPSRETAADLKTRGYPISKSGVNNHRKDRCACDGNIPAVAKNATTAPTGETLTAKVDVTSDGGEFVDVQTTEKITNWDHVFAKFELDPEAFIIDGDHADRKDRYSEYRLPDRGYPLVHGHVHEAWNQETSEFLGTPMMNVGVDHWFERPANTEDIIEWLKSEDRL